MIRLWLHRLMNRHVWLVGWSDVFLPNGDRAFMRCLICGDYR